jgi:hypothetical protein
MWFKLKRWWRRMMGQRILNFIQRVTSTNYRFKVEYFFRITSSVDISHPSFTYLHYVIHALMPWCSLSHWTCLTFYKIFLFISVRVFDVHSINDIFNFPHHTLLTPSTSNSLYVVPRLLVFSLTFNVLWRRERAQ